MERKGEKFYLKWQDHQSILLNIFDSLLINEKYADCILAAEGQVLRAHKVILSACSPYLEYLLNQQGTDKHPILIFNDIKFNELKSMMNYIYKGEVNVLFEQLDSFLKAGRALQIKGLTEHSNALEEKKKPIRVEKKPSKQPPLPKLPTFSQQQMSIMYTQTQQQVSRELKQPPMGKRGRPCALQTSVKKMEETLGSTPVKRKRKVKACEDEDSGEEIPPPPPPAKPKLENKERSISSVLMSLPPSVSVIKAKVETPPQQQMVVPPPPPTSTATITEVLIQAKAEVIEAIKEEPPSDEEEEEYPEEEEEEDEGFMRTSPSTSQPPAPPTSSSSTSNPASLPHNSPEYNSNWQVGEQGGGEAFMRGKEGSPGWKPDIWNLDDIEDCYDDELNMYLCKLCGKTYQKPQVLLRHLRFECGGITRSVCEFCPFETVNNKNLIQHIKKHHFGNFVKKSETQQTPEKAKKHPRL